MIGVVADPADRDVVAEFFSSGSHTPSEWLVPEKRYRVVLSAGGHAEPSNADLALVYGADEHSVDRRVGVSVQQTNGPVDVQWRDMLFPVYGRLATFQGQGSGSLLSADGHCAGYCAAVGTMVLRRIGYDLFGEVSRLLSEGQPRSHALIPTLERHVAFIRQCLEDAGISYSRFRRDLMAPNSFAVSHTTSISSASGVILPIGRSPGLRCAGHWELCATFSEVAVHWTRPCATGWQS